MNSNPFGETLKWLLEADNPSVRYFTMTGLLDESPDKEESVNARQSIMETGAVPEVLSRQAPEGCWGDPKRFYTDKYRGTVWTLMILAEHGADGLDPRIAKACEFILENSQEHQSGGFSTYKSEKSGGGLPSYVIPCLTGNLVWSLIRLGYLNDARVQRGIDWINTWQRFDDGDTVPPKGGTYDRFEMCWGRHSCHMGVVKALKALAEIPPAYRSAAVQTTIDQGVEYFLIHHVFRQSHNLNAATKPGWKKLGFPLMYQTDILEILDILTGLGVKDDRMQEAVDIVAGKQDPDGRWNLENNFNGKFQVNIERIGKPSKWITLRALQVLKRYYGETSEGGLASLIH